MSLSSLAAARSLIAQNGYFITEAGIIFQWGRDSLTGGGATTVTFPMAFPNQCFQVIANPLTTPSTTILYTINVETFDVSSVNLTPNRDSAGIVTSPSLTALWFAIGY